MNSLDSSSCPVLPTKWDKSSRTNPFLSLYSDILLIPASTSTDWKERSNKQDANKHSYSIELSKMDSNRRSDPSSSGIVDDSFAAEIDHMPPPFPPTLMNLKNHFPLRCRKRLTRLYAEPFPYDVISPNQKLSQCKWRTRSYSLSRRTERRTQCFQPLKSLESFWLKRG